MPTSLDQVYIKLMKRTEHCDKSFKRALDKDLSLNLRIDKTSFHEGLISKLWQSWCTFSRELIISSIRGATTRSGGLTSSTYSHYSEEEICHIAKLASTNSAIKNIKKIPAHSEPTWGSLQSIGLITIATKPSNQNEILQNITTTTSINLLQHCRNACAHINTSTYSQLKSMQVSYSHSKFRHPSDVAFWIDPATNGFLWDTWVADIQQAAERSTQ